ncbi:MAG: TrkH family potassium uptake protein [Anaerolineales bacterium]
MSYQLYLRGRYRAILAYMGVIWSLIGLITLAPLLGLLAFPEESALAPGFLMPGLFLLALGLGLALTLHPEQAPALSLREGSVIIVLSWIPAFMVGLVPFMLVEEVSFIQALFEATSGWTTTGLSVIDVTTASRLTLLYRSMMQLAGGAGFVIVMMTFILGPAGSGLSAAEGRGDQLAPHVRRSALLVLRLYSAYVLLGVVALWLAGMDWFDAVIHSFSAISTGGFSSRPDSIAHWNSPVIEGVVIMLMLLGSTNFLTAHTLLRGRVRAALKNSESRFMFAIWTVAALVLLAGVGIGVYPSLGEAARAALFETLSALSSTGYTIVDYSLWGGLGWLVIMTLMTIGGGTNSSAGGMKQFRIYVLFRTVLLEFERLFLPKRTVVQPSAWVGERHVFLNDEDLRRISVFFLVYLSTLILGALIITSYGYPLADSLFEFASTVGTVGMSVGVTSAEAPPVLLLTQVFGMFLGRLEYFTVIAGLVKLGSDLRRLA